MSDGHGPSHHEHGHSGSHGKENGGFSAKVRGALIDQFLDLGQIFDSHDALGEVTEKTADAGIQTTEAAIEPGQNILSGESKKSSGGHGGHGGGGH